MRLRGNNGKDKTMMDGFGMGFGWIWTILIIVLAGVVIATLLKYLHNSRSKGDPT